MLLSLMKMRTAWDRIRVWMHCLHIQTGFSCIAVFSLVSLTFRTEYLMVVVGGGGLVGVELLEKIPYQHRRRMNRLQPISFLNNILVTVFYE